MLLRLGEGVPLNVVETGGGGSTKLGIGARGFHHAIETVWVVGNQALSSVNASRVPPNADECVLWFHQTPFCDRI